MNFTLYTAEGKINKPTNVYYPTKIEVVDEATLQQACGWDYVGAKYLNDTRSNNNFMESDCLMMDIDNDHTEIRENWIYPEDLAKMFPDVAFGVHFSRNHLKEKGNRAARPKFHIFFPVNKITDGETYSRMKGAFLELCPFCDCNAQDAARFFFGTENPEVQLFEGTHTIDEILELSKNEKAESLESSRSDTDFKYKPIPEGQRNRTLFVFALKAMIRNGINDYTREEFQKRADSCETPLPEQELKAIWHSAEKYANKVIQTEGYIPPEEYDKTGEPRYMPNNMTDLGQATLMAELYGNIVRYSPQTDFICFNGNYWVESKEIARSVGQNLTRAQVREANDMLHQINKEYTALEKETAKVKGSRMAMALDIKERELNGKESLAENYLKYALKRQNSGAITACMSEVAPLVAIEPDELDKDKYLLCTPDGTYDLRYGTKEKTENRPENLITRMTSVAPDAVNVKIWNQFLREVFCEDEEVINYAQFIAGTLCIGEACQEKLIIAYGQGANGKSTFWNTLFRVLGSYSGKISAEALTTSYKQNIKNELAELRGKRFVIASEMDDNMRLNTSFLKQICSKDEILAEKKYKDPFYFTPSHSIVLYTNHLPKVRAIDEGTWRRLMVVPFNAHFSGITDKINYSDYLMEHCAGAILRWMMDGAKMAIKSNYKFETPQVVLNANTIYQEDNNWLEPFINECCEVGNDFTEKSGLFYQAYRDFCGKSFDPPRAKGDFYGALDYLGYERKKFEQGVFIKGIRLKDLI